MFNYSKSVAMATLKLVRPDELAAMLGVCRHTIYHWVRHGQFPEPIKIGQRASAWRLEDIERWLAERPTKNEARQKRTSVKLNGSPQQQRKTMTKSASEANAGAAHDM